MKHAQAKTRAVAVVAAVVVASLLSVSSPVGAATNGTHMVAIRINATSPTNSEQRISGTAPIRIRFSTSIDPRSPIPSITPAIPGRWTVEGRSETFVPSGAYPPDTTITVTIPGGRHGIEGADGARLHKQKTLAFTVENGSILRAEQLLAELDYLPVTWIRHRPIVRGIAAYERAAFFPPPGRFMFVGEAPAQLRSLWNPDVETVILRRRARLL